MIDSTALRELSPRQSVHREFDLTTERMIMRIYLILALILAILVTIFAVQNNEVIDITFLAWTVQGSLALVLMITFALGIGIGLLISSPSAVRSRLQMRDLNKKLQSMEKELQEKNVELEAARAAAIPPTPEEEPTVEIPEPESIPAEPTSTEDTTSEEST
ncbi:MAG: DUF1049 domain-containing protein [Anaerolineales bacterium]|nr:DUF1049 domain-containing protein [Anaerolineales bacterium]